MHIPQVRLRLLSPFCLVCIVLVVSVTAAAQDKSPVSAKPTGPQSYRSGLKSIVIPPPTEDLSEIGPDYRVLLESNVPDTNRLLAAFLGAEDSANIRSRISKGFYRYALVENVRRAEFIEFDADAFKQVSNEIAKQFGADLSATMKDEQEELNHKLKAMHGVDTTFALDKPLPLGVFFSKPNACSFGMIEQISSADSAVKMVAGMTILKVQDRLIYAYVYSQYKDEGSVQWVRNTSEQWADAILKANQQ
ncbi:MAG: hypothetical protein ABR905_05465 [Terracidiphilus sp.]|jgi:hypothetical protein